MKRLLSGIARALASTALVGQEAAPPEFPGGTAHGVDYPFDPEDERGARN